MTIFHVIKYPTLTQLLENAEEANKLPKPLLKIIKEMVIYGDCETIEEAEEEYKRILSEWQDTL